MKEEEKEDRDRSEKTRSDLIKDAVRSETNAKRGMHGDDEAGRKEPAPSPSLCGGARRYAVSMFFPPSGPRSVT